MTTRFQRHATVGAACVAAATVVAAGLVVAPATSASAEESTDRVVLAESFDSGSIPADWTVVDGTWSVVDGELVGQNTGVDAKLLFGENLENFALDADIRFDSAANASRWLALVLDAPADGSVPWQHAAIRNGSNAANGVEFAARTASGAWNVTDTGSTAEPIGIGRDAHLRVEVQGNVGTWYVDGKKIMRTRQLVRTADGVQGLIVNNSTVAFDNVAVTEIDPLPPVEIVQPGATGLVVAHRGNSSAAPENTMPAFVSATRSGADYFEIDIAMTADKVPVVMHDGTVDRTTDGTGAVGTLTLEQIRALDAGSWFSAAYTGTKVPTFEEVLAYVASGGTDVLVEYKGDWSLEDTQTTNDLVEQYGVADKTFAQSFSTTTVANIVAADPELPVGWLTGAVNEQTIATTKQLGADAVNPSSATAEGVALAHAAGLGVFVWTQNNPTAWESLTAMGVDGIITDRPGQLVGWNLRYNQDLPPLPVEPPAENEQDVTVSIPEAGMPTGEFTWRFSSQDVVSLGTATQLGDSFVAEGELNDIEITDTRATPAGTWSLSAQASPFASASDEFSSSALGWTPKLKAEGAGAVAGPALTPGTGDGLSKSAVLASTESDEYKGTATAVVGADLALRLPVGQKAGEYRSTLTVTVIQ